jgi:hypothetical protein
MPLLGMNHVSSVAQPAASSLCRLRYADVIILAVNSKQTLPQKKVNLLRVTVFNAVEQNVQMTVKYVSNMSNVTWSMDVV